MSPSGEHRPYGQGENDKFYVTTESLASLFQEYIDRRKEGLMGGVLLAPRYPLQTNRNRNDLVQV